MIAMGITHANRLDDALRLALRDRRDLDEFFAEGRDEPFFIKNLERVQGDERDAIILSVGYGKAADGRLLYHFGPINLEGGERRLNVAVTRAKRRMTVVSSFGSADMDPKRASSRGAQLLRDYLIYAESRGADLGDGAAEHPPLNPFEIEVRDHLERAGVPLVAQLGASGYRIDFAAQHPQRPGQFVLAIECDGASYHSSATARDRDRLRQDQLERLGWRFHRIWSGDWFGDRERAVARAVAAYRRPSRTPTREGFASGRRRVRRRARLPLHPPRRRRSRNHRRRPSAAPDRPSAARHRSTNTAGGSSPRSRPGSSRTPSCARRIS